MKKTIISIAATFAAITMSAQTVSGILDLSLLGSVPEDPVVYRALLKHSLFIHYDCEARNAVLRIQSRLKGNRIPVPSVKSGRRFSLFSRQRSSLREVTPIDDH